MKNLLTLLFITFSINVFSQTKVVCTEVKKDTVLTKTCVYKNTKIVETCDLVGKDAEPTGCSSAFFMKKGRKYVTVDNCEIFNEKQDSLLILINNQIKEVYKDKSTTKGGKICFANHPPLKPYGMKNLEISFSEDKVIFKAYFDLSESCKAMNTVEVVISMNDIEKYLK
ncbi:MAG: hypothetical protein HXX09_03830 [Bacteroidetes bacterium]|nr:hypothetical protein [Bacteroidota bacterium]